MALALQVAVWRPRRIGDGIIEAEHIVRTHRAVAIPAFGFRGVVELQGVVDPEGDGEGVRVLLEEFARILGADLRGAGVVEVRVRVERVALGLDGLTADHREEHRLLLVEIRVKDAIEPVRKSRRAAKADGEGPVFGEFVEPAQLAPAEIRTVFVGDGEPDLIARLPVGAAFAGEGEEDAEVLFAEAADRDAGRARVVAEQEDGLTDDRAAGGVAFFGGCLDAGRAGGGGAADIDRERGTADALGFIAGLRTDAGHAFAPIGERARGGEFIDLGLGREHDRRPDAGVE